MVCCVFVLFLHRSFPQAHLRNGKLNPEQTRFPAFPGGFACLFPLCLHCNSLPLLCALHASEPFGPLQRQSRSKPPLSPSFTFPSPSPSFSSTLYYPFPRFPRRLRSPSPAHLCTTLSPFTHTHPAQASPLVCPLFTALRRDPTSLQPNIACHSCIRVPAHPPASLRLNRPLLDCALSNPPLT